MTRSQLYNDDYMKASEYLRMVLAFLAQHKIPASPINYQIGYEFVSGGNPQLQQALEELLQEPDELTESQLLDLYKRYIAQDEKALDFIRQELHKIITHIQNHYQDSQGDLGEYLTSLNSIAQILTEATEPGQLMSEVRNVIDRTRATEENQRSLDTQLSSMMEEVESLRKQLDQVREESLSDALTGLANRLAADQTLEKLTAQEQPTFSVAIGDIDHFKQFNDSYGHLVGDKVLRYVGQTIKSCIKGKDLAARYGGEEFLLVLPDTGLEGAAIVAEQARDEVSKKKLTGNKHESYGKVTLSLGVAEFRPNESVQDMLNRADQALYQAKNNGRNRVERAS